MAEAVGVTLPVEDGRPAEYVALARLAERSGYDAVLAGEVAGPEVFSLLGDETVHSLCAVGPPSRVAELALRISAGEPP